MSEHRTQWLRPEVVLDELFTEQVHVPAGIHALDGEVPAPMVAVVAPDDRLGTIHVADPR